VLEPGLPRKYLNRNPVIFEPFDTGKFIYDSTAKTFFTAKTAKNAKKFLRILRIQAENLQENLRDINFFFATFASSR